MPLLPHIIYVVFTKFEYLYSSWDFLFIYIWEAAKIEELMKTNKNYKHKLKYWSVIEFLTLEQITKQKNSDPLQNVYHEDCFFIYNGQTLGSWVLSGKQFLENEPQPDFFITFKFNVYFYQDMMFDQSLFFWRHNVNQKKFLQTEVCEEDIIVDTILNYHFGEKNLVHFKSKTNI